MYQTYHFKQRKQQLIEELDNIYESEIKKINADEDSVSMQLSSLVSCSEFTQKVGKSSCFYIHRVSLKIPNFKINQG